MPPEEKFTPTSEAEAAARDIFRYALDATRVATAMERRIHFDTGWLVVDELRYELSSYERILLVAIGKAAGSMTAALLKIAGDDGRNIAGVVAGVVTEQLPRAVPNISRGPSASEPGVARCRCGVASVFTQRYRARPGHLPGKWRRFFDGRAAAAAGAYAGGDGRDP